MVQIVSITDFRKNLFQLANQVIDKGEEIEVEKDGRRLLKLVKINDDSREMAIRALKVMKKIGGKFKNVDFDRAFFRGAKEKRYMEKLGNW